MGRSLQKAKLKLRAGLFVAALLTVLVWAGIWTVPLSGLVAAQSGSVAVSLNPPSINATQGQVVLVNVLIDASSQPIDTVQVYLGFDPALLQVVDASGNPATSVEFGPIVGAEWKQPLLNHADNAAGTVGVAAGKGPSTMGGVDATNQFLLASVRFKTLAESPSAIISFDTDESQTLQRTKAYYQGSEVTGLDSGAIIVVSAAPAPAGGPAPAPVVSGGGGVGPGGGGGAGGGYVVPTPSSSGSFSFPVTLFPTPLPPAAPVNPSAASEPVVVPELTAPDPPAEPEIARISPDAEAAEAPDSPMATKSETTSDDSSSNPAVSTDSGGSAFGSILLFLTIGLGLVGVLGAVVFTNGRVKEFLLGNPGLD